MRFSSQKLTYYIGSTLLMRIQPFWKRMSTETAFGIEETNIKCIQK